MKSTDVDTTIIDGEVLYSNKEFTRTSRRKIHEEAETQVEKALGRVPFGQELLKLQY